MLLLLYSAMCNYVYRIVLFPEGESSPPRIFPKGIIEPRFLLLRSLFVRLVDAAAPCSPRGLIALSFWPLDLVFVGVRVSVVSGFRFLELVELDADGGRFSTPSLPELSASRAGTVLNP